MYDIVYNVMYKPNIIYLRSKAMETNSNKACRWYPVYGEYAFSDEARRWTDTFMCSACGAQVSLPNMVRDNEMDYNYCPYCGAHMTD